MPCLTGSKSVRLDCSTGELGFLNQLAIAPEASIVDRSDRPAPGQALQGERENLAHRAGKTSLSPFSRNLTKADYNLEEESHHLLQEVWRSNLLAEDPRSMELFRSQRQIALGHLLGKALATDQGNRNTLPHKIRFGLCQFYSWNPVRTPRRPHHHRRELPSAERSLQEMCPALGKVYRMPGPILKLLDALRFRLFLLRLRLVNNPDEVINRQVLKWLK